MTLPYTEPDHQLAEGAARLIFDHEGESWPQVEERFTVEFARAAVTTFASLHRERGKGFYKKTLRKARRNASRQSEHRYQGILEVLQNADDQNATTLQIDLRGQRLSFAHDGRRVAIRDILPMAFPYASGKEDRADTTGRFGIGLKTLDRLGSPQIVDSYPYHFAIRTDTLEWLDHPLEEPPVGAERTRIYLDLKTGSEADDVADWLLTLDASLLLFLRSVRRIMVACDGRDGPVVSLTPERVTRMGSGITAEVLSASDRRSWTRYSRTVSVPDEVTRPEDKDTGDQTWLAIATPRHEEPSRVYVRLPTQLRGRLPWSMNAEFEPTANREGVLVDSEWNAWLLDELFRLASDAAGERGARAPRQAWRLVPLPTELEGSYSDSFRQLVAPRLETLVGDCRKHLQIAVDGKPRPIDELVYEADALDRVLSVEALTRLYTHSAPHSRRRLAMDRAAGGPC